MWPSDCCQCRPLLFEKTGDIRLVSTVSTGSSQSFQSSYLTRNRSWFIICQTKHDENMQSNHSNNAAQCSWANAQKPAMPKRNTISSMDCMLVRYTQRFLFEIDTGQCMKRICNCITLCSNNAVDSLFRNAIVSFFFLPLFPGFYYLLPQLDSTHYSRYLFAPYFPAVILDWKLAKQLIFLSSVLTQGLSRAIG